MFWLGFVGIIAIIAVAVYYWKKEDALDGPSAKTLPNIMKPMHDHSPDCGCSVCNPPPPPPPEDP